MNRDFEMTVVPGAAVTLPDDMIIDSIGCEPVLLITWLMTVSGEVVLLNILKDLSEVAVQVQVETP